MVLWNLLNNSYIPYHALKRISITIDIHLIQGMSRGRLVQDVKSPMKNKKLIRQSEFAREMGISRQRVNTLIKRGIIQVRKDGKINFESSKKILEDNRATSPKMKNISYSDARAQYEILRIEKEKIELRKIKHEIIDIDKAIEINTKIIGIVKNRLLAISSKIVPIIVGETSMKKIKSIIDNEIIQALNELGRMKNAIKNIN